MSWSEEKKAVRSQILTTADWINGVCTVCIVSKFVFRNPLYRIKNRSIRFYLTGMCIGGAIVGGIGLLPETRKLVRLFILPIYYSAVGHDGKREILKEFNKNFTKYGQIQPDGE